jgi:nitrite reductase/ring-hydroxylating ferredoxin subunit
MTHFNEPCVTTPEPEAWHPLCPGSQLQDSGEACVFDVIYDGQTCTAFAVRYQGVVHAYLNRCSHVAMEMDWRAGHFFDLTGHNLVCASHGALFRPGDGVCVGGPGRGPLIKIQSQERDGWVFWQSQYRLRPVAF